MGRGGVGVTFCQVLCLCKTEAKVSSVEPYRLWPSPSSLDLNRPAAAGRLSSKKLYLLQRSREIGGGGARCYGCATRSHMSSYLFLLPRERQ